MWAYEFKPIHILVCLHKLVDVSVRHPLRHHRELNPGHFDSEQWQHVRMIEGFPHHELLAEHLHRSQPARQQIHGNIERHW